MKKSTLAAAICSAIIAAPATSFADEFNDSGFYVFPSISYFFMENERNLEDTTAGSLAIGYDFNEVFGTELSGGYFGTDTEDNNTDVDGKFYRLDGLVHLNNMHNNFRPYLVGGVGNFDIKSDLPSQDDEEMQFNLGVGFKKFFNEAFALRADVRALYGHESFYDDAMLNVGFTYLFGKSGEPEVEIEAPPTDSDNDGVYDPDDNCPGTAPGTEVDAVGCELKVVIGDTDQDGIPDDRDKCPNTRTGYPVNENGCALDTDRDGIVDGADQCANTPSGAKVDALGCRILLKETVTQTLNVQFASNSADVPASYESEVERLATFMTSYPDTQAVIEGHTDDRGNSAYNQQLSERRAKAITDMLISNYGVRSDRLSAIGYGEARPIADNSTSEGRMTNRRVDAVISTEVVKSQN